ncbi:response regulator transcription factor [Rubrivirga marina]|uniref:Response regulatory domain-containing protein n=1 Tax=Rubrivirga marina TaxID=1196024 RepID=A0A271IWY7_9BACT|nr:response regulator [Rubrivirga marina]PAP75235.1 hypothetical protein BSZ37_01655 [Rubrivirga marina]
MPDQTPRRVFLVDDHRWLLDTLAHALSLEDGIEVCGTAASGEEAIEALPDAVDVLLVDMRLPGMSGPDVVRALADRRPDVACVVVSAKPAVEASAEALDAGAAAYVEKGDFRALVHVIRTCCAPV